MVALDEPRLTHVVVDKRDESRRLELIKRTAKYVECCFYFYFLFLGARASSLTGDLLAGRSGAISSSRNIYKHAWTRARYSTKMVSRLSGMPF